jgi:hypothetical protein
MSKRVSIGLMVGALCFGIAPMADAGHCHCHVRHHKSCGCCPVAPTCGCTPAPTCGCTPAPTCGCSAAPSCGAPAATPMMAPTPATPPAPAPPAPGKAAEYSPNGTTPTWRIGDTSRTENQTSQSNSAESSTGIMSNDSTSMRSAQNDSIDRTVTIQKRSSENSIETSRDGN